MKKFLSLILAMVLVISIVTTANADGLFGSIVQDAKESEPDPLPSFSVYSQLPYDKKTTEDNKVTFAYSNVSMDAFEAFGVYLEKLNYAVWDSDAAGTIYIIEIGPKQDDNGEVLSGDSAADDMSFVIKYDTKTSKLEMIYPATAKVQDFAFLNTISYTVKAEKVFTDSATDHFGNTYSYSIGIDSGSVSVPVNGKYSTFTGIIAYPGERSYDSYRTSAALVIYGDGKKLYESPDVEIGTYPIHFSANVTDCKVVEIVWTCKGGNIWDNWCYEATIYNGMFY